MNRWLYTALYRLLLPLLFARLWWRGRKNPAYRERWSERLALYQSAPVTIRTVIFHTVSVGEVHAAQPLIERFLQLHPTQPVVVTTTTPTGSDRVRQLFGARVLHVYLPYDLPGCVDRFLARFRPRLLVLMETELWPNLLEGCAQQDCRTVLVNARLSPKSLRTYQRIAGLSRAMLGRLAAVAAQSAADAQRFEALGLDHSRVIVSGSLKYDIALHAQKVAQARQLKSSWQGRPVLIAASTREGEDAQVLAAFQAMLRHLPTLMLVLVPRHLERFASAAAQAAALRLNVLRFSSGETPAPTTQVLVGDTLGDMHYYYSLADIAFVGGSLVNTGCQNIIEAAALGLPIITGPSLFNFQAASDVLREAGALQVVPDAAGLAEVVVRLMNDPVERQRRAAAARHVVGANTGATERMLALIEAQLSRH